MVEETRSQVSDPSPKNVRQVDPKTLEIIWTDGHESVYSVRHLRENCPCASCIDE
ncbi:MAG: gamma-butyrobetaine hydroxylase-like domain-containing protein, partial [Nitrospinaceae bacterium]|nr:gamma-butyrobetaine hydroxylase-like domain-containing protein [Nitrospinaceae bacterium]